MSIDSIPPTLTDTTDFLSSTPANYYLVSRSNERFVRGKNRLPGFIRNRGRVWVVGGLILFLCLLGVSILASAEIWIAYIELNLDPMITNATVTNTQIEKPTDDHTRYVVTYHFKAPNDQHESVDYTVNKWVWGRISKSYYPGLVIPIRYAISHPTNTQIVGDDSNRSEVESLAWIALIILFVVLALGYDLYRLRRFDRQLSREGQIIWGQITIVIGMIGSTIVHLALAEESVRGQAEPALTKFDPSVKETILRQERYFGTHLVCHFITPSGETIKCSEFSTRYLSSDSAGNWVPRPGLPIAVLYVDESHYEIL